MLIPLYIKCTLAHGVFIQLGYLTMSRRWRPKLRAPPLCCSSATFSEYLSMITNSAQQVARLPSPFH